MTPACCRNVVLQSRKKNFQYKLRIGQNEPFHALPLHGKYHALHVRSTGRACSRATTYTTDKTPSFHKTTPTQVIVYMFN